MISFFITNSQLVFLQRKIFFVILPIANKRIRKFFFLCLQAVWYIVKEAPYKGASWIWKLIFRNDYQYCNQYYASAYPPHIFTFYIITTYYYINTIIEYLMWNPLVFLRRGVERFLLENLYSVMNLNQP